MTADEEARHAIGVALLRAFAARADAPPELTSLLDQLGSQPDAKPSTKRKR